LDVRRNPPSDVQTASDKFTDFILAHGETLAELNLALGTYCHHLMAFNSQKLTKDSLPHLRSFKGNIATFRKMVGASMECLRTLELLDMGPDDDESPNDELEDLFNELDSFYWKTSDRKKDPHVMRSLKELKLDLSYWEDQILDDTLGILRRCGDTLGQTIEVWKGDVFKPMNLDYLVEGFSEFPMLRAIHMRENPFYGHSSLKELVLTIAAQCYRLEEVIVFDMHPETRRKAKIPAKVEKVSVQIARDEGEVRIARIEAL